MSRRPSINVTLDQQLLDRLNAVCRENLIGRALVLEVAIERIVEELEARPVFARHQAPDLPVPEGTELPGRPYEGYGWKSQEA